MTRQWLPFCFACKEPVQPGHERQHEAWPSKLGGREVITNFKGMLEIKQSKKMATPTHSLNKGLGR